PPRVFKQGRSKVASWFVVPPPRPPPPGGRESYFHPPPWWGKAGVGGDARQNRPWNDPTSSRRSLQAAFLRCYSIRQPGPVACGCVESGRPRLPYQFYIVI